MAYPQLLSSLTPREAVADTIYRVVLGVDRNDAELFDSGFIEDVTLELPHRNRTITGISALRTHILGKNGPLDTMHTITNMRVNVHDGTDTAYLTAYTAVAHAAPGTGRIPDSEKYITGVEYRVDLVKDTGDGLWKIKKWIVDVLWTHGNPEIIQQLIHSAVSHPKTG